MINQNSKFMAILTRVGEAKLANANALGVAWKLTHLGVGDANDTDPIPDRLQTRLINERRRAPVNQLRTDPANTSVLIAEQIIPADVGGFWIREIGLYDADGDLVAVSNCAPSYKPLLGQGSGRTQIVRMNFVVSSADNITLKIDPAVVLATRQYVDERTFKYIPVQQGGGIKQTPSAANKIFIGYSDSGDGRLRATVDATDLGPFAFTSNLQALLEQILGEVPEDLDTLKKLAFAVGNDPNYAQNVNKVLAKKADAAASLDGYGIPILTKLEAEAGEENSKPTTILRVAQYVAVVLREFQARLGFVPVQQGGGVGQTAGDKNKVFLGFGANGRLKVTVDTTDLGNVVFDKQLAQEAEPGLIQLATTAAVQQGADALSAVTPKNLRLGFFISLGVVGYIVFPSWMGSFMVQWGRFSLAASTAAQAAVSYPIPFGTVLHAWTGVDGAANDQVGTLALTTTGMTVSKGSSDTAARSGSWFAIGGAF